MSFSKRVRCASRVLFRGTFPERTLLATAKQDGSSKRTSGGSRLGLPALEKVLSKGLCGRCSEALLLALLAGLLAALHPPVALGNGQHLASPASPAPFAPSESLANAPAAKLMEVYGQLRQLQGSAQTAVTENAVWKRDAATFTFKTGRITFAAPVAGRVVAAVFTGDATFELDPPTPIEQRQVARFTGQPRVVQAFKQAVFFFTDDSWAQLQKLVAIRQTGDAAASGKILATTESRYQRHFNSWWDNGAKGYPAMNNLAARMLADLSDPSSKGLFLADMQCGRLGNLLYQISWNRPSILLPMVDNDEEVMLLRYKAGEYFEWWAGFHLAAEYKSTPHPTHHVLMAHCGEEDINADISKDNRLSATARMDFTVRRGTPRILPFNLAGVLRISGAADGAGKPLAFIQEDRSMDSDPWLILPSPAATGTKYTAQITYQEDSTRDSRVIEQRGQGLFFVGERTSWYPSFGAFQDRTNFKLHFTSPKEYQFIATGRLVDSQKEKSGLVTDYVSQMPFSVVGFNYGDFAAKNISGKNLTVTAYAGKHVPDELVNLEGRLQLARMAGGVNTPDLAARSGILEGGFNTVAGAKLAAARSYNAFRLYQAYFGPLPFHKISVTEQPVGFFGQSWPTLVFLPYLSLLDPTTLNSLGLESTAEGRQFFDVVAVHEMSHQWWGHMVGWKTYHDQWLSEGFADFSAALYLQAFEPKRLKAWWDYDREILLHEDRSGRRPVDIGPLWLNEQLNAHLDPEASTELIYRKGAYVLEMLRTMMQNPRSHDPDAAFIAMMHDFVQTYAGKNASTQDFERVVEKDTHQDMSWFFNEWVYGTETPTYDFAYKLSDGPNGKTLLHMSLTQSGVSDSFMMSVPLYLTWKGQSRLIGFIHIKGPTTAVGNVTLGFRPEKVTIDEYHSLLAIEKQ